MLRGSTPPSAEAIDGTSQEMIRNFGQDGWLLPALQPLTPRSALGGTFPTNIRLEVTPSKQLARCEEPPSRIRPVTSSRRRTRFCSHHGTAHVRSQLEGSPSGPPRLRHQWGSRGRLGERESPEGIFVALQ